MNKCRLLSLALLVSLSLPSFAQTQLVPKATQESRQQQAENQQRENAFLSQEQQLAELKRQLEQQKSTLEEKNAQLSSQFSDNEVTLSHLEEELRVEMGSLGELFGVVRQHAKELKADLNDAVTAIGQTEQVETVNQIVAAQSLPDIAQLKTLWHVMQQQIVASGEMRALQVNLINTEGAVEPTDVIALGNFALLAPQGYVNWKSDKGFAIPYAKLPEGTPTLDTLRSQHAISMVPVLIDPTRGVLLEQYAHSPSLADRFAAGGVVGKVIFALLAVGIIIASYRGILLLTTKSKIRLQLKQPNQLGNNPLGRVLAVYDKDKPRSVEALELRLLETIVDEQTGLEKGLSMLKLLAALAPMLGLLGTVIGMIETFQVITQFGNGDPKVMASGISMALVTTVLGLVAAMPLLLAHNVLSGWAEEIRSILEKQGIGLVAQQAEQQLPSVTSAMDKVGNAA
ncbi:MotA/TolQ/ExbB proton channel family protein [Vibrio vulnificus]|nr:MotA/TolQ/ExbB proton channel family protein [Vibrio vulnificus]